MRWPDRRSPDDAPGLAWCHGAPGVGIAAAYRARAGSPDGTQLTYARAVATVQADAFCHSMVRSLVGVVVPVGEGRRQVQWPAEVLRGTRRDPAVSVMPPHGLSLEEVSYPPDDELAARAAESRVRRTLPT